MNFLFYLVTICVLTFIFVFVAINVSILVHELGHLVAGLMSGYRFSSFTFLGKTLFMENGQLKIGKSSLPAGAAGQCLMVLPEYSENFPYKLYNYGGAIANVMTAALCLLIVIILPFQKLGTLFFLTAALINLVMAFTNAKPLFMMGLPNDGANVREANKSALAAYGLHTMLSAQDTMASGKSIGELDYALLAPFELARSKENYLVAYGEYLRITWLFENNQIYQAIADLKEFRRVFEQLPEYYGASFQVEFCAFSLIFDEDNELGLSLYSQEQQQFLKRLKVNSWLKSEIAYQALAKKDYETARKLLEKFEKELDKIMNKGIIKSEKIFLNLLEERIKKEEPRKFTQSLLF